MDTQTGMLAENMCDCCGRPFPGAQLSPATAEPQMTVCDGCQHHLERESRDGSRRAASQLMRRLGNGLREVVMRFEFHETKLLAPMLRWIDRRSPW